MEHSKTLLYNYKMLCDGSRLYFFFFFFFTSNLVYDISPITLAEEISLCSLQCQNYNIFHGFRGSNYSTNGWIRLGFRSVQRPSTSTYSNRLKFRK